MDNTELRHVAQSVLEPMSQWKDRCHEASVALVASGVIKGASVARGACKVVPSQHSWVVLGDPYLPSTVIIDPTLWCHTNISPEVYVGTWNKWRHRPKGFGNIYEWGKPSHGGGKTLKLPPPKGGWSDIAKGFLNLIEPLDEQGWRVLATAPVQGWPATEILTQMRKVEGVGAFIPIDIVGMVLREVSNIYPRS